MKNRKLSRSSWTWLIAWPLTTHGPTASSVKLPSGCWGAKIANNNVIFRIPTSVFGLGLLESVPEDALVANLADSSYAKTDAGIQGSFNRSGNDGTITRFGWKAQNKSLLIFAGEAYNVEQGVSNKLFPNERATLRAVSSTAPLRTPLTPRPAARPTPRTSPRSCACRRRRRRPPRRPRSCAARRCSGPRRPGHRLRAVPHQLADHGLVALHRHVEPGDPSLHRPRDPSHGEQARGRRVPGRRGWRSVPHRTAMGRRQADLLLHDGRATPGNGGLVRAILAHASTGSEASPTVRKFTALSAADQQAIIDFLRSL